MRPQADAHELPEAKVPLAPLSTLGVGGTAAWLWRATSIHGVAAAQEWAASRRIPVLVLGGGSNVVVADRGFGGLVLQPAIRGVTLTRDGSQTLLRAGAGESWDLVVATAVEHGLSGLECLSGIPGTVGGTPVQNVGAYGQEVSAVISSVAVFDRLEGRARALSNGECGFEYRASRFKTADRNRFVVCEVSYRLASGAPLAVYPDVITRLQETGVDVPSLLDVRESVLAIRRGKGMVIDPTDPDTRSVGSFFLNPVVSRDAYETVNAVSQPDRPPAFVLESGAVKIPAAWLIERAGFERGYAEGPVGLSSKHPLAIVNRGGATAADIIRLATRIARRVEDLYGIRLRPEPAFVGDHDHPDLEYLLDGQD